MVSVFEVVISNVPYYINNTCKRLALLEAYKLHIDLLLIRHPKYPFDINYIDNVLAKIDSIDDIIELIPNDVSINKFS